MVGPPSSVAQVRVAVRRAVAEVPARSLVLVACSGGPDSMALAAALAFEAPKVGVRWGLVTVDHQLQPGSAQQAERVAKWAAGQGFDPVEVLTVDVGQSGGPEAAARDARYLALEEVALRHDAAAVLMGHTRDDQAETVLLALARGSGARAIAGMPASRGFFRRPLLDMPREIVHAAAQAEGLPVWDDPHNTDDRFARSRMRALLPALEHALGGGVVAGLARSATRARQDSEFLDGLALRRLGDLLAPDLSIEVSALANEPAAIRSRILHLWAAKLGASTGALASVHVEALCALVSEWRGQGPVHLPGGIEVVREHGRLRALSSAA